MTNATELRPDCNTPLTPEQLMQMDGKPIWIEHDEDPKYDHVWMIWNNEIGMQHNLAGYNIFWRAYAFPPARIDREAWTAEWKDHYKSGVHAGTGAVCSSCDVWNERKTHICPFCGKAMDEDGLAMLKKRLRG